MFLVQFSIGSEKPSGVGIIIGYISETFCVNRSVCGSFPSRVMPVLIEPVTKPLGALKCPPMCADVK